MGGKKKTKWRKLPLEEFTRQIPTNHEKVSSEDVYKTGIMQDQKDSFTSYVETAESNSNAIESYENSNDFWYPTTNCVVYNPSEVGYYSNYMLPVDAYYYYPTLPQIQELVPMLYQEYIPQVPKESLYILSPIQPIQPIQRIFPERLIRRQRTRNEDQENPPEKSNQTERYDHHKSNEILKRDHFQPSNFKRMASLPNTNNFHDSNQSSSIASEVKKHSVSSWNGSYGQNQDTSSKEMNSTENNYKQKKHSETCDVHTKTVREENGPLPNSNQGVIQKIKSAEERNDSTVHHFQEDAELFSNLPEDNAGISSLPHALNTIYKSMNDKTQNPYSSNSDNESQKSKSLTSQISYLPNLLGSEASHNEMETELKLVKNFQSLQGNQSIYKLAFDENITDQSDGNSKSPSPLDPEYHVPSSLTSTEILIHEADSGSEAGSEDVELIPHRYESETFLSDENKHVYVNRLSLAVELLRTQETLPYDDEFKRVVGENHIPNDNLPSVHTKAHENRAFQKESSPVDFENFRATTETDVISRCQLKQPLNNSCDLGILSAETFDMLDDDGYEGAKEVDSQDNVAEGRAGYRRFGVHPYFSPRTAVSVNPCFCCIIM